MERRQCAVECAENLIRIEWPELHLATSPPDKVVQRYALVRPTGGDGRDFGWLIALGEGARSSSSGERFRDQVHRLHEIGHHGARSGLHEGFDPATGFCTPRRASSPSETRMRTA
jgi:hypothetical protein